MGKVVPLKKIVAEAPRKKTKFSYYPSYGFEDHDPILDQIDDLKKISKMSDMSIADKSHVSLTTLKNWHFRKVKRPQFSTIMAVIRGIGADAHIKYKGKIIKF